MRQMQTADLQTRAWVSQTRTSVSQTSTPVSQTSTPVSQNSTSVRLSRLAISDGIGKARFIRLISAVSNAIETIDNEMICFIIYCLNCIRHGTYERGLTYMPEFLKTGLVKIRTHSTTWLLKTTRFVQRPIKKPISDAGQ